MSVLTWLESLSVSQAYEAGVVHLGLWEMTDELNEHVKKKKKN